VVFFNSNRASLPTLPVVFKTGQVLNQKIRKLERLEYKWPFLGMNEFQSKPNLFGT
jgi:hypothetical protein